jgi:hypothetical protein
VLRAVAVADDAKEVSEIAEEVTVAQLRADGRVQA